jgi:putative transposase
VCRRVRRDPKQQNGFAVRSRQWVVERTFTWLGRYRRLSTYYEEPRPMAISLVSTQVSILQHPPRLRAPEGVADGQ